MRAGDDGTHQQQQAAQQFAGGGMGGMGGMGGRGGMGGMGGGGFGGGFANHPAGADDDVPSLDGSDDVPDLAEIEDGVEEINAEGADETGLEAADIELVQSQAGVSRAQAVTALRNNQGDVVSAIMDLTM